MSQDQDDALNRQGQLVESLAASLRRQGNPVELFETHISWVLVAGGFAYKFKKAVRLDFVDYSTLDSRRFYCHEELRLNRKLAPHLYLAVVAITGSEESPAIDENTEDASIAVEYAVKMHAFRQEALWTYRIENRLSRAAEMDELALVLVHFHRHAAVAPSGSPWCTPDALRVWACANLDELAALMETDDGKRRIGELRAWDAARRQELHDVFVKRKAEGCIRECHGDLHSGNLLTLDGHVEVFDCIEFNDSLRWIDTMNDIAFTRMDLAFRGCREFAVRLLNQYLETGGDFAGLAVLRYYEIHRALVRCKVALLRARQLHAGAHDDAHERIASESIGNAYLAFAMRGIRPAPTAVMITHGFSGSGKTTFARMLAELTGAIHMRSDVERKRMHGLSATERATAPPGIALYDRNVTQATYARLRRLAAGVIASGYPVIVDAAFLATEQRELFKGLAAELSVPFFLFDIRTDEVLMQARIAARAADGKDASDAGMEILMHQLANHDPLSAREQESAIAVDMNRSADPATLGAMCWRAIALLRPESGASGR